MKTNFRIFKIFVAIGLLCLLFFKIDIVESLSLFTHLNLFAITSIFFVTFWLIFVSVLKWQVFLKSLDLFNPFWRLYRYYIIGYFFSNFLPSNIGGDLVRFSLTAKGKETYTTSFVAVFMERFTGIIATLLLAFITMPLALWYFEHLESILFLLFPIIAITILFAVLFFVRPKHFDRYLVKEGFVKYVFEKIREITSLIQSFSDKKKVLFKTMFLSIMFNLLTILNVYVVGIALDLQVKIFDLFILVPLILLISSIPLSINAIGIAEGAYVLCLSLVGFSASEALSIALLMRAKTLVVSLLGGLFLLAYRKHENFESIIRTKPTTKHPTL